MSEPMDLNKVMTEVQNLSKQVSTIINKPNPIANIAKSKTMQFNGCGLAGVMLFWDEIEPLIASGETDLLKWGAAAFLGGNLLLRWFTKSDLKQGKKEWRK